MSDPTPICDYEGSDYRTRFWEEQDRDYEDLAERIALRRLLPRRGDTLLDVGAGFGRLAGEYAPFRRVVLLDYSRSLLREAQAHWGHDDRFTFVAADWYQLPFVPAAFDCLVQVRTIHHAAAVPDLLAGLARCCRPGGSYILEFANKLNLKAMLRYLIRRQDWSPFHLAPIEFVPLNYDFHPRYMADQLHAQGFCVDRRLAVSFFRLPFLKRRLPSAWLARADGWLQPAGRWLPWTPSLFLRCTAAPSAKEPAGTVARPAPAELFACPRCQTPLPTAAQGRATCRNDACGTAWAAADRFYDFKSPLT